MRFLLAAALPLLILLIGGHHRNNIVVHSNPRTNELDSAELGRREHRLRLLLDGKHFDSKASATSSANAALLPLLNTVENGNNNNNGNIKKQQQQHRRENSTGMDDDHRNGKNDGTATTKYKVVRAIPETDMQLRLLERLEVNGADLELNFWTSPVRTNSAVDIMLPAGKVLQLRRYLHKYRMHTEVIIDDVERLIIQRERKIFGGGQNAQKRLLADEPMNDAPVSDGQQHQQRPQGLSAASIDFHHYNSYAQMVAWMRSLAKRYPKIVQFISIGKTHEGRSIDGLEIGSRGYRKRAFWIDGGIHAREWAAPHTAMYFIHQLTSRYGHDEDITRYVNEITWIVVPLLNPDGYEYTRSATNPNIRLWRKNRSPTHCIRDQWGRSKCCKGVDLNRNFDFHFKESGSSDDPCSEIYQGKHAFSEPEAKAVRDAILSNRYRGRIDGFITLHTYSQIWIHPFGHKRDSYPGDVHDLAAVGKKAAAALSRLYGTKYVVGSGADTLYPASGGSEDWAKESANVKFVYLLELRPDEKNWDGFILDEGQLMPTASETWAGVRVVADAIIQRARARRVQMMETGGAGGGEAAVAAASQTTTVTTTINHEGATKLAEQDSGGDGGSGSGMPRIAGTTQYRPSEEDGGSSDADAGAVVIEKPQRQKPPLLRPLGIVDEWVAAAVGKKQQQQITATTVPKRECVDRRRACKRWVLQSAYICQAVPVFMGEQCARSCGFCTP